MPPRLCQRDDAKGSQLAASIPRGCRCTPTSPTTRTAWRVRLRGWRLGSATAIGTLRGARAAEDNTQTTTRSAASTSRARVRGSRAPASRRSPPGEHLREHREQPEGLRHRHAFARGHRVKRLEMVAPFRSTREGWRRPKVYRPKPHIPTMSTAEDARSDHCSRVSARIGDGTR